MFNNTQALRSISLRADILDRLQDLFYGELGSSDPREFDLYIPSRIKKGEVVEEHKTTETLAQELYASFIGLF